MGRTSGVEQIASAGTADGLERRKQHRYECEGPADVTDLDSGSHFRGEMKDLSLTGCYILSPDQLELARRSDVELRLCVNGDSLTTPARVILVRPESGAAFEFLPIDPEMRATLLELIQKLNAQLTTRGANKAGRQGEAARQTL